MDGLDTESMWKVSLKAQIFAAVLLIIFVLQAFSAERVYADELHYVRDNM